MIQRFDVSARLSKMAVYNGMVYLAGQIAGDATQDIAVQTRQVLAALAKPGWKIEVAVTAAV